MNFDISNHTLSTLHLADILIGRARYKRQGKGGEPEICEVGLKWESGLLWFYVCS